MARAFRGRGGTAGYDSHRNSNGRNAAHDLSALRVHFRPVVRDHDLRRQLRERLEPPEGAGKAHPGQSPSRTEPPAANRHGLEHHGPDLLVHAAKHESPLRPDGAAVHRRLGAAQAVQIRSQCRGRFRLRRHGARVSGARRSEQAGVVRIEHRPGGAATRQQQHQCRRQLRGSRHAADERPRARALQHRAATSSRRS